MNALVDRTLVANGSPDWQWLVGVYNFVDPGDIDLVQKIKNTLTEEEVVMPSHLIVKKAMVGTQWIIVDNFAETASYLKDTLSGLQQPLAGLFKQQASIQKS
eukprot:59438-Lingulodinium_polyedra.AAC.2